MSFNGSGTFIINSTGQPVVTGTVISSTAFNALTADLANGLSTTITKNGQTTPTANLPMGGFKFTGMANGSAGTDSATVSQIQSAYGTFLTVAGTDTITASVSPALTAYSAGQMFGFVAVNTNTGATTINISSLGAKSIVTPLGALNAGDIQTGYFYIIYYDGTNFQLLGISTSTVNLNVSGVLTLSGAGTQLNSTGTGAWKFPNGTTGQRPATPVVGMARYNSTLNQMEAYVSAGWQQITSLLYSASYLVVAGGGGGGGGTAGGAGAGGVLTGTVALNTGTSYPVVVGAGGAGGVGLSGANGINGVNSSISTLTAIGGGGGASFNLTTGSSGGSGGGGSGVSGTAGGAGTSGQGNAGAAGIVGTNNRAGGGGGGASAVGSAPPANGDTGGVGGAGTSSSISGSAVNYGGGGGGGTAGTNVGAGGVGGGGAGATVSGTGTAGTINTGGGGGGAASNTLATVGGNGGSGIVIISYAGAQRGTGGTVTTSGGNTIHTFTTSGTYTA